MVSEYKEIYYRSSDNHRLYARDYQCEQPLATVLCLHGLTRNCADFHRLSTHLQQKYRVITVDQRGRGRSDYVDSKHYKIDVYVRDMFILLDKLSLDRVCLIGTSMGGLMAMAMAVEQRERFQGLVLNDIGPEIDPQGIKRIRRYISIKPRFNSLQDAIRKIRLINGKMFPNFSAEDWNEFVGNIFIVDAAGQVVPNYDLSLMQPILSSIEDAIPTDTWSLFDAIRQLPILLVRGELSDILNADCVVEMQRRKPDLQVCEVAGCGHAPRSMKRW